MRGRLSGDVTAFPVDSTHHGGVVTVSWPCSCQKPQRLTSSHHTTSRSYITWLESRKQKVNWCDWGLGKKKWEYFTGIDYLSCEGTYFLPFGLRPVQFCRMTRLVHNSMKMLKTAELCTLRSVHLGAGETAHWVKCVLQAPERTRVQSVECFL